MPAVTTAYCTIADVQNRLSSDGVTYRTDDSPPTSYGDVLDEASRIVDTYAYLQYGSNLALSNVVKHWTANIAAYLLCERRGNLGPGGISHKFERTMEDLGKVLTQGLMIPDIAQQKTAVPVLSNVHVKLWPLPHTVVERQTSTGTPAGYKVHRDNTDPVEFWDAYCIALKWLLPLAALAGGLLNA